MVENSYIEISNKISDLLMTYNDDIHVIVRSPEATNIQVSYDTCIMIPVTDHKDPINFRYKTVGLTEIYDLFKAINAGVEKVYGYDSEPRRCVYISQKKLGTVVGDHSCGYEIHPSAINDFRNHCKIKLKPSSYIIVLTVKDVDDYGEVVNAIENIMGIVNEV